MLNNMHILISGGEISFISKSMEFYLLIQVGRMEWIIWENIERQESNMINMHM